MKNNTAEYVILSELQITYILGEWGYENYGPIGKGAFSHVYRVKENATGRFGACKVSTEQKMLKRESLILQQISHSIFPLYHDFKQHDRFAFLFMEYVSGISLGELLAGGGCLSERQAIRIAMELADGLCYLHERDTPLVFRDLKPENIIIREDGRVKLVDFGSAGPLDTSEDVITGTPGYAAPEQWETHTKVGFYSDVYALGKVMYYMLTGKRPEKSYGSIGDMRACTAKIHRGVEYLMADCLRGEAQERIPDMRCFLNRLAPYDAGQRWKILCMEIKAFLSGKKRAGYIYQQNILR